MTFFKRVRSNLTTKLAWLVTLSVLLLLFALGAYFDEFLRANFLVVTSKRMQHVYERLGYNLNQIEAGLKDGAAFAKADERLLASVELINHYQDKQRYSPFLIDEEKKTLATQLLDRVKLSMNSDIVLFDKDDELVAYASRVSGGYQIGYLSHVGGKPQIFNKNEGAAEFQVGQLPVAGNIREAHLVANTNEHRMPSGFMTSQQVGNSLTIINHQSVFDSRTGRALAHLEMARNLDAPYFAELSREMDVDLKLSFESDFAQYAGDLDSKDATAALIITELGDHYVGVMKRKTVTGVAYFSVAVDRAPHNAIINTHRYRFLLLMAIVGAVILTVMRVVIHQNLALPLGQLMAQIRRVEKGDYALSSTVNTGDELQEISVNVNRLAHAVHEREQSLERARNEQEYLSNHDSLTGLPNRRFFTQRLEHALDLARRKHTELAVLFMDLDQFKSVNDTLGHDVGDDLLLQIGERLHASARSSDTLARIGGDEFNVLIENVSNIQEVEAILEKYLTLFCEPFTCRSHEINITVSIGVALYPQDGADSISLLKYADLAVYKAKESGRDRYSFFSEDLARHAHIKAEMIHSLKVAIESGNQLTLHYQPKVNVATGKVVSAEALIRWNSPEFGAVSPLRFIPLSEETGQILAIGEWVIHQGCKDLAAMNRAGITLEHLSMNVSNVQMRGHDLGAILREAIGKNELSARQIELEITESYIAEDIAQAIGTLNEFRALGVQLAIDDFGTGYSSMSSLHRLPFTRMKIDKSIIDRLPDNHDSVSITRAMLGLAKSFGLAVTAEGVERADQLQFLRDEGCDEIQGYYFAKPMPLDDFIAHCRLSAQS